MEVTEIVEKLKLFEGKFQQEAVEAALAQREEVTPALLRVLEEVAERGTAIDETGEYMAHLYAMFLLAQVRETRAYPLVVRIAMLPSDVLDELFGDFLTEGLNSVLASVCDGNLDGIKSIIECETANEWARSAALGSLVNLVVAGVTPREGVVEYFASLFRGRLARTTDSEVVWGKLVYCTTCLYPEELMEDIEKAFGDGLIDSMDISLDEVQRELAKGKEQALAELAANPHNQLIQDTVREFGSWASFHGGCHEGECDCDCDCGCDCECEGECDECDCDCDEDDPDDELNEPS